jgi:S1-C subfamily serine protease
MSQMTPQDPYQPIAPQPEGEPMQASFWAPPPPPPAPPKSGEPHLWRWLAVSFLVAMIAAGGSGIGVGWGLARAISNRTVAHTPIAIATPATAPGNGSGLDMNAIAAKVDPAIVDINTIVGTGQAAGTGIILTSDGEVLTNNHVVDGSSSIKVAIEGRSGTYSAHVVGVAPAADVALIQVDGVSGLPTVTLASSASLQVGDQIVALGNALGQGGTPSETSGSVIALNQSITASEGGGQSEQLTGMIQADASISPGDSGGPIVNSAGQVVGMITAGDVQGFRSQTSTVDYAIPSDTALSFVNKIRGGQASSDIVYGQVGLMGVSVRDLSSDVALQLGLNLTTGALVVSVQSGSPAQAAGITPDSVITKVGGTAVTSSATLGAAIRSHKPGEAVSVTWVNAHGTHNGTVTLTGVNP